MDSPLTQQLRPDTFEPKVVQLYLRLFTLFANEDAVEDATPSEGFWRELFLLKPDKQKLFDILDPMTADDLLHIQLQTRTFFRRAIVEAGSGTSPRNENALENLSSFLSAVFTKKYTNPSTDVIDVLAGLNAIDRSMSDLVNGLEVILRQSTAPDFRSKAVTAAMALVSGAFQTSLVTYFMHKDLFPALMKLVHDVPGRSTQPFILTGILANYNKFESQNVYHNRVEDFVNEDTIRLLVQGVAHDCLVIRDGYVSVQDDSPTPWTITSTLSMVGLRALSNDAKKPPPLTEEETKTMFSALPARSAAFALSLYSYANANKLFATDLLSLNAEVSRETPFALVLSTTSYLAHHAYRGIRPSHYAMFCLLTIRLVLEDASLVKRLSSAENRIAIRLCRQRPPHLPLVTSARVPVTAILDICTDIMSHNLRKKLDVNLYSIAVGLILRIVTHLETTKTRLQHHWSYIWGSLLSLIRFLTQYATDLKYLRGIQEDLCPTLANLLAFCLTKGDGFLPDPASYDDLFYKLIEVSDIIPKFKEAYCSFNSDPLARPINALISVSSHYHDLIKAQHGKKMAHQSPAAIQKVIKEGYETLNLDSDEGFGKWERWRESSWKAELKKMVRTVVEDARVLALA